MAVSVRDPIQRAREFAYPAVDTIPPGMFEIWFAVVALYKEGPSRSAREIGRIAGTTHPTVGRILRSWAEDPEAIEAELLEAGYKV